MRLWKGNHPLSITFVCTKQDDLGRKIMLCMSSYKVCRHLV